MKRIIKRFVLTVISLIAMFVGVSFVYAELTNSKPENLADVLHWRGADVQESKVSAISEDTRSTTYIPPVNIYLPKMMFLVVKDIDGKSSARCKNMAYRTVDSFSRRVNSNLVRADEKLYTLARIVYDECIDITLDTFREGL